MTRPVPRHEIKPRHHPSGRPIRRSDYCELGFPRPVRDEPLTPGLKPGRERTQAIGFGLPERDDEE